MSQSIKGTRDLRKLIPRSRIDWNENPNLTTIENGWEILVVGTSTNQFAVYRTYIDVVGWSKDEITAFTQGASFQECDSVVFSPGGTTPLKSWDMVTVNYIEDSAFTDPDKLLNGTNWSAPGTSFSNYNLEEILAGRWREFAASQDLATSKLIGMGAWGCGDATAGDRIYITKVFLLGVAIPTAGRLIIPEGAVVIPTLLVKEADLVYLERLRRSYVLAENR